MTAGETAQFFGEAAISEPLSKEELRAANIRLRRLFVAALAESYAYALRNGDTMESICTKVGQSVEWGVEQISEPGKITLDSVAIFALGCGCEVVPKEITE